LLVNRKKAAKISGSAKKASAATNQPTLTSFLKKSNLPKLVIGVSGVKYVTGNITDLKGDAETLRVRPKKTGSHRWPNKPNCFYKGVFVCIDDGKVWPTMGVFPTLAKTWPTIEKKYQQYKHKIEMGTPIAMKVPNSQGSGLLYSSLMLCISCDANRRLKFSVPDFESALSSVRANS